MYAPQKTKKQIGDNKMYFTNAVNLDHLKRRQSCDNLHKRTRYKLYSFHKLKNYA